MIVKNIYYFLIIGICAICSCSGIKRLPPGEKLYTGASVQMVPKLKLKNKNQLRAAAKSAIRTEPNSSFLGVRLKLWMYQKGDTSKKGLKKFLRKQGEPPVLLSKIKPNETVRYIDTKLFNAGIFNSRTEYKVIEKKRTAKIIYICHVHPPYSISEISYSITNEKIMQIITTNRKKSLIKSGDDYNLETLKKERERVDGILKNNGYYFFNPDYLVFHADTSSRDRTVKLQLTFKEDVPEKALKVYKINSILIDPQYSLMERNADSLHKKLIISDSIIFTDNDTKVKPRVILKSVLIRPGAIYSRKQHNNTLNRLMTMGTYKFVRIHFSEKDSISDYLNTSVFLTPLPKRTLRYEINLISKSNDFLGPQLNINYQNRNTFKGAELLNVNFGGSFETQITGKYKNLYSYSLNSKAELIFPRFLLPFNINNTSSFFVPKTKLSLSYNYLKRVRYFDLRSLQFVYSFKWKETATKEHELAPINVNQTTIANQTPEFNELLQFNPFIKKSYEQQFIAGLMYSYVYNEQILERKKHQLYFNTTFETSGNSFSLYNKLRGRKPNEQNPFEIGNVIYSEFSKVSFDIRSYLNFKKSKLAERLFVGLGKAYGNSSTLPYIKQFFSGGPNSIRAFAINSVGPSTYSVAGNQAFLFLQQGGDMKLEGNIEYRFDVFKSLKGAIFSDAGNTWLFEVNPSINGNAFSIDNFYKEIAVGAGIGLRIDVSFFVLRFDLATPLRKPWLPENNRWVFNSFNFSNADWRSENLVLNVAIGYPF